LKNFSGVFVKIHSSGDFRKFLIYFSIKKSMEYV
jgi:hypothetical protein